MVKLNNLVPSGPLYRIRAKGDYPSFTLGPDPEFIFTAFACVGLNAVKILRAINRRVSVQMASVKFKPPVANEPEWVVLSNVLMREYNLDKPAKYRELKVLKELGFLEEHKRKSENSSRIVRVNPEMYRYKNLCTNQKQQRAIKQEAVKLRKQTRRIIEQQGDSKITRAFNKESKEWDVIGYTIRSAGS